MSRGRVLVTGGAGFIGSHLVDRLLKEGYPIRMLDALVPQVHPNGRPAYLNPDAEFRQGDVRDPDVVRSALQGVEVVVHLAAAVGVGRSMYEIAHYSSINVVGTANLLEVIVKDKLPVGRLIVASSMTVYGEGRYECGECGFQDPSPRPVDQLERHDWAMYCPRCGRAMEARPTPETKAPSPTSVYAINKRDQEEMVLTVGASVGIPAVALRFFSVYGQRQALSNPYTGVGAVFASALLNGHRPLILEDGYQIRDLIHVSDVVRACMRAIQRDQVRGVALNVGTGRPVGILELARLLARKIPGAEQIEPEIVNRSRPCDIRACYADTTRAGEILGVSAEVSLEEGLGELSSWVASQSSEDRSATAFEELVRHRLLL